MMIETSKWQSQKNQKLSNFFKKLRKNHILIFLFGIMKSVVTALEPDLDSINMSCENWVAPLCVRSIDSPLEKLHSILKSLDGVTITHVDDRLITAIFTMPFLRWQDEFQFRYLPEENFIHVTIFFKNHSFDFEANRSRIEKIRKLMDRF